MPGIHFYFDPAGNLDRKEDLLLHSARSLLHEKWFILKTLISKRGCFLCATYHPKYPVAIYENNEYFICLEGMIYGETAPGIDARLSDLANILFGKAPLSEEKVRDWLLATDGDFVIFIQHRKTGGICILNDALGRLPLYYRSVSGRLTLSRESRFITNLDNGIEFDRLAMAQYLLLGFMPGEKTFFQGISRLDPATLITIDPRPASGEDSGRESDGRRPPGGDAARISFHRLHTFDFSVRRGGGRDVGTCAAELVDIFRKTCRDRADSTDVNVLSLSGGLDSRAVASALVAERIPFQSATFLDHFRTAEADVKIAETIAGTLEVPWRLFPLGPTSGGDVLRLLRMKNGSNFLGMSFSMKLFDMIRDAWGERITFFTGEGGGLTVPDNRPYKKLAGTPELTGHVISRNSILTLAQVAEITGLSEVRIRDSIGDYLASCPENGMSDKYLHFIICGRDLKWTAEGEDRNRFFFWTVAPFNSPKVIDYVMNCPDRIKSRYRLYREFLLHISPQAASIKNANWNMPVSGNRYLLYFHARELYYRLPETARKLIRKRTKLSADLVGPYDRRSAIMACFMEQFEGCEAVPEYLSQEAVARMIPSLNKYAFDHLFTVSSLIEDLTCGESSIERYFDRDMI